MVGGSRSANQLDHGDFAVIVGWQLPTHWQGPIIALIAWVGGRLLRFATIVSAGSTKVPTIKHKPRVQSGLPRNMMIEDHHVLALNCAVGCGDPSARYW